MFQIKSDIWVEHIECDYHVVDICLPACVSNERNRFQPDEAIRGFSNGFKYRDLYDTRTDRFQIQIIRCCAFTMRNISVSLQPDRLMLAGRILLRESPTCLMDKLRSKRTWNGKARQKSWDEIFGSETKIRKRSWSKETIAPPSKGFFFFFKRTNRWSWSPSDRHHRTTCPPGFWPCSSPGWGIHRGRCCPANCAAISRRRPLCAAF